LEYQDKQGEHKLEVDKLIVAVGRSPYTGDLGADQVGLKLDAKGFILVDQHCRTNLQNVYAVGDVVRGPMLAHKGEEEGVMAAELIAGQAGHVNYETIPWIIYTMPEIAWVGQTEEALKATGVEYNKGTFPFSANGRAQAISETAGFVKILAHAKTDRILGVHILGALASEMITEAVVAMEFSASAEDVARIIHAHPTLSEAFHEAALGVGKRAINI
jgi:dihydrolipoamide dehydrogenase